eukprot:m.96958 g.96958  ORF g.96958 m.96958 type:complete len:498 (-) comp51335_c0_seq1:1308-2801(-)
MATTEPDKRASISRYESVEFGSHTESTAALQVDLDRLLTAIPSDRKVEFVRNFEGFARLFSQWRRESGRKVDWVKIKSLDASKIHPYSSLPSCDQAELQKFMGRLVVVKLNGGLGTSMGCTGPKSAISVRDDRTFLDLVVQQNQYLNSKYGVDVPLVLMNSFNTDADTSKLLRKYAGSNVTIKTFNQSQFPRIIKDSNAPMPTSLDKLDEWYPPGHGDFYASFERSGLLDEFIAQGKDIIFLSNIDNLGATVDEKILQFFAQSQLNFIMELTDKTRADVKGGTLIDYEGNIRLLEIAQVPKPHVEDFKRVSKFAHFNTNNLWVSATAIKHVLESGELHMEIIENKKTLKTGLSVIQLETAVGAAIKCFQHTLGVNVPRSRFLPVKKTSDLLLVMSNLYNLKAGSLTLSPGRTFGSIPLIKLGGHFDDVSEFLSRFESIPDLLELDHLTITGDVRIGANVSLKGTVIICANYGDRIDIPPGSVLDNKIVSGSLRILEH